MKTWLSRKIGFMRYCVILLSFAGTGFHSVVLFGAYNFVVPNSIAPNSVVPYGAGKCKEKYVDYVITSSAHRTCDDITLNKPSGYISAYCWAEYPTGKLQTQIACSAVKKAMKKNLPINNCHGTLTIGKCDTKTGS